MLADFFYRARFYFYAGELQKSRDVLLRGRESLTGDPDDPENIKVLARLYTNLAATCIRMLDLEPADRYLKLAEELAEHIDPPLYGMLSTQANCRGAITRLNGDMHGALKHYQRAEELARGIDREPERNRLRRSPIFNIAMHYLELGKFDDVTKTVSRLQELEASGDESKDVADAGRFELLGQLIFQLLDEPMEGQAHNVDSLVAQALQHFTTARELYQSADYGYRVWQCDINILRLQFRAGRAGKDLEREMERIAQYSRENESPGMTMQVEVLRVEFLVAGGERRAARELILRLVDQPPDMPQLALASHFGKLKEQAELLEDEELTGRVREAIGALAVPAGAAD